MLKKATNQKITRYEYESEYGLYYVDIIETETQFDAWITGCRSGLSSFAFGELKQNTYFGQPVTITRKEFMEMVEENIDEYIDMWEEELMDIEEMNCEKVLAKEGE